jgi:hypothetical protein
MPSIIPLFSSTLVFFVAFLYRLKGCCLYPVRFNQVLVGSKSALIPRKLQNYFQIQASWLYYSTIPVEEEKNSKISPLRLQLYHFLLQNIINENI